MPLLLAMAHVIEREGLADAKFIAERTTGGEAFATPVSDRSIEYRQPSRSKCARQ